MLTDNDRKYLLKVVGKDGAARQLMMFCLIPLMLLYGCFKFYLATLWIGLTGHSIHSFLVRFAAGTSADQTYSGSFIHAADDVTFGIFAFGLALIYGILWWAGRQNRERTQRIVNALKNSGGFE